MSAALVGARPQPSLETQQLRRSLKAALDQPYPETGRRVGSFTCGVYAFYDYDGEPIYVGQTIEGLSSRVSRHLTNQRTDAVAMSVLDPFEVCWIELYPLTDHDGVKKSDPTFALAQSHLNQLELAVYNQCIAESQFGAILNEKEPARVEIEIDIPKPLRSCIVSDEIRTIRGHPDVRIARRAQTIARLAQVISERQVNLGLRNTLATQAARLEHLARAQLDAWANVAPMPVKSADEPVDDGGPEQYDLF